jgi:hypothetical protein
MQIDFPCQYCNHLGSVHDLITTFIPGANFCLACHHLSGFHKYQADNLRYLEQLSEAL